MKRIFNLIIILLFIGNYAWTQELVTEELDSAALQESRASAG